MDLLNPHSSKDVVTQRPGINLLFMATFEKNLASDIWNNMKVTSAGAHSTISTMHFCLDNLWKNQGDCKIRCMLYAMSSNHGKEWRRTRVDRQWLKIGQIDTFFHRNRKRRKKVVAKSDIWRGASLSQWWRCTGFLMLTNTLHSIQTTILPMPSPPMIFFSRVSSSWLGSL